jgi:glycosyltransferase involved in cell wall biosynthesis
MPRISVIVAAFNAEQYLAEALASISIQVEQDLEAIIVDDGSRDKTQEIAKHAAKEDRRFRVISQANSGKPACARNAGLRVSRGEFLCFLDADDKYHREKLSQQLGFLLRHPDVSCVFHDVRYMSEDGSLLDYSHLAGVNYLARVADHVEGVEDNAYVSRATFFGFMATQVTGMHTSSVMIRRSAVRPEELQFAEDLLIGEDIDLWFRVAMGRKVAYINRELSYYRQHSSSMMRDTENALRGFIAAHSRNLGRSRALLSKDQIALGRRRVADHYEHLGFLYMRQQRTAEARECYARAFKESLGVASLTSWIKTFVPRTLVRAWRQLQRTLFVNLR